jgi:hypothetical protein
MALRITAIVAITIAAMTAATDLSGAAAASGRRPIITASGHGSQVVPAAPGSCYVQLGGDSGAAINSQKLKHRSEFNDRAADDFRLTEPCTVQSLDVDGVYFGPDRLLNASVVLYQDEAGTPGAIIARRTIPATKVTDSLGSFHVPLGNSVSLDAGTYWLGFRVRMPMLPDGGGWFWFANQPQRGNPAVWKNRGDAFGLGCRIYHPVADCFRQGMPHDLAFAVNAAP